MTYEEMDRLSQIMAENIRKAEQDPERVIKFAEEREEASKAILRSHNQAFKNRMKLKGRKYK